MHGTVLIDIDTQNDFLLPVGSLYVPGAEKLIPTLERLYDRARRDSIPVISTVDAHAERDPEFQSWPPHCIVGTLGQSKVPGTLMTGAIAVPNRAGAAIPDAQQVIVEKQTVDVFQTATMRAVLAARPAERYLVFGVVTEICVLHAVRGLRTLGKNVDVYTLAIKSLDFPGAGRRAIDEMRALGAKFLPLAGELP